MAYAQLDSLLGLLLCTKVHIVVCVDIVAFVVKSHDRAQGRSMARGYDGLNNVPKFPMMQLMCHYYVAGLRLTPQWPTNRPGNYLKIGQANTPRGGKGPCTHFLGLGKVFGQAEK